MMTAVKNIPCQHHDANGADEGETQWMSPTAMEKCTVHCDVRRHAAYDMTIKVEFCFEESLGCTHSKVNFFIQDRFT